ncbi:MAG TPA: ribosome recycling factor, partial [Opitutae bacterium]|nr:ribosome recycling factor [Opitutae bacterium]
MDLKKIIADGTNSMKKAVEWTQHELATLHTGKASPSM